MGPLTSQCCGLPVAKKQGDMARHKHRKQKMLQVKVNGFIEWVSCDKANNNEWGPLKEEKNSEIVAHAYMYRIVKNKTTIRGGDNREK